MDRAVEVIDASSRKGTDFERSSIDVSLLHRRCAWLYLVVRRSPLPETILQHMVIIPVIDEQEFGALGNQYHILHKSGRRHVMGTILRLWRCIAWKPILPFDRPI